MAIHHRDIIKVMPIAPVKPWNKCLTGRQRFLLKRILCSVPTKTILMRFNLTFTQENPYRRNDGTSYKLQWNERLWAQEWTLVELGLNWEYEITRLEERFRKGSVWAEARGYRGRTMELIIWAISEKLIIRIFYANRGYCLTFYINIWYYF